MRGFSLFLDFNATPFKSVQLRMLDNVHNSELQTSKLINMRTSCVKAFRGNSNIQNNEIHVDKAPRIKTEENAQHCLSNMHPDGTANEHICSTWSSFASLAYVQHPLHGKAGCRLSVSAARPLRQSCGQPKSAKKKTNAILNDWKTLRICLQNVKKSASGLKTDIRVWNFSSQF